MLVDMEGVPTFAVSSEIEEDLITFQKNISVLISGDLETMETISSQPDQDYEQFLADVWVGIILTLIVLSCVCCMCSCLLYHKFQQWKRQILAATHSANLENGNAENESLPSYTIVSGLPSYDEALEQLRKVKEMTKTSRGLENVGETWTPHTPPTPHIAKLSVTDLFQLYKTNSANPTSVEVAVKNQS